LVGFFLAYWQHLLAQRGGLNLLLLDDPQELLDGDNRERLSAALSKLSTQGAQLLVTTHDSRFATLMIRSAKAATVALDHRSVHPPTLNRPTLLTSASVLAVEEALHKTQKDEDDVKLAQDYASECRIFIEARLGDFF
jgi:ABC-type nitrate/sulfonate/bicarbonate transport system ATPase subunit